MADVGATKMEIEKLVAGEEITKEIMIRFIRNLQFANNDIMRNVYLI